MYNTHEVPQQPARVELTGLDLDDDDDDDDDSDSDDDDDDDDDDNEGGDASNGVVAGTNIVGSNGESSGITSNNPDDWFD